MNNNIDNLTRPELKEILEKYQIKFYPRETTEEWRKVVINNIKNGKIKESDIWAEN